jgi:DNA polymerase III epsilon subunit-like protein
VDTSGLLQAKVADVTWVAFDTEATGYSNVAGRLVEIAGVKFRFAPGDPLPEITALGEFGELMNPGVPIPEEVVAIHGIADAAVAGLPGPVEVLGRFLAFTGDAVLVAHYVPFDVGAMTFALLREKKPVPRVAAFDTSILPKRLFPGAPNYALGTLVHYLGLPPAASHRAMPDALSTLELFRRCVAAIGDPAELTVADLTRHAGPLLTFDQFADIAWTLPDGLLDIDVGIAERRDLTIAYRGGSKGAVPRRVTPSHLFARDGALFLEAYCHLDQAAKSFRIDRIEKASLLPYDPAAPVFRNRGSGHWVKEAPAPATGS